jgi:GT2 family glycosyltransferase
MDQGMEAWSSSRPNSAVIIELGSYVNERNYGFAEGNNIGIRAARGKYIVLLNIDTEVEENWLDELEKVLERDETIGAAQCKILRMDDRRRFD